jgi:microbial collagenase
VARKPVATFTVSPRRPTVAEAVRFVDRSHDPGARGIAWRAWDFGDGGSSVGAAATHRYAEAGRYEVTLTVATYDGRVGTESRSIDVGV